jgi:hypothetical protein
MRRGLTTAIVLAMASTASAQSPYVSASVGLDVSTFSGVDVAGARLQPGGEAIAVSLRAGTDIGERWGVEVGFTRPATTESESTFGYPIPLDIRGSVGGIPTTQPINLTNLSLSFPTFQASTRLERRDSTIEVAAWVSQSAGPVQIAYVGGVAFTRTVEEVTYQFPRLLPLLSPALILPAPASIRSTTYGAAPLVGIDARFGLTEHLRLVAGVRLQSIGGGTSGTSGWIVRPSVGALWRF